MTEHIDRMKIEYKELKTKLTALDSFIYKNDVFKTLSDSEKARMIKQSGFMGAYADVLAARIQAYIGL